MKVNSGFDKLFLLLGNVTFFNKEFVKVTHSLLVLIAPMC